VATGTRPRYVAYNGLGTVSRISYMEMTRMSYLAVGTSTESSWENIFRKLVNRFLKDCITIKQSGGRYRNGLKGHKETQYWCEL
jgi:hypothetical protein